GKFIAESRKNKNMTQEELAQHLNVSNKSVSRWETGKNMPDVSIMQDLCNVLDISLNELFVGNRLAESEVLSQSEKNILDILNVDKSKWKRNRIRMIMMGMVCFALAIIVCRFVLIEGGAIVDPSLACTQVYIAGEGNIKGEVDVDYFGKIDLALDIGANQFGYAVFKNPQKAMDYLKTNYAQGINAIQKEYKLLFPLNNFTYQQYGIYGWQLTTGTEEEMKQASFVSSFIDIYENSFNS
ncbi:MAG: helix-turn-helix transcriptional regulator, partial [Coprobacillus sp.]